MSTESPRLPNESPQAGLEQLSVGEFMNRDVITVGLHDVIDTVLDQMVLARRGCVVVVSANGIPAGLICEPDLNWYLSWVRSGAVWSSEAIQSVRARSLMQSKFVTARAEDSVASVLERMRSVESRDVPIVDSSNRLIGLVTQSDLFGACAKVRASPRVAPMRISSDLPPGIGSAVQAVQRPISSLIRKDVVHLAPTDPIQDAIDLMAQGRISCILITIELRPVGILTERDVTLLSSVVDKPFARARDLSQVMQSSLLTIHEDESIFSAMSTLNNESIRHLPVVNDAGRLAGVVTQTDLIRACRMALELEMPTHDGRRPEFSTND